MLPAGRYYIGDPCYVFKDEDWDKIIDLRYQNGTNDPLVQFEFNGKPIWSHYTALGDGEYPDQYGDFYPVDSGSLGAVPIELVVASIGVEAAETSDFMYIVMEHPWTPEYEDGVFTFGDREINTNSWNMGEDEDDEDL